MITLVVYVENKPGVLNRVASLFRRRLYNIESLTVGHTERPGVSRMTVVVDTDDGGALRLEANLYKLLNVLRVDNITTAAGVWRELALIKVTNTAGSHDQLMHLAAAFNARVLHDSPSGMVMEIAATTEEVESLVEALRPHGIMEMVRTGRVAMATRFPSGPAVDSASQKNAAVLHENLFRPAVVGSGHKGSGAGRQFDSKEIHNG